MNDITANFSFRVTRFGGPCRTETITETPTQISSYSFSSSAGRVCFISSSYLVKRGRRRTVEEVTQTRIGNLTPVSTLRLTRKVPFAEMDDSA